jgi:hypothetical protein
LRPLIRSGPERNTHSPSASPPQPTGCVPIRQVFRFWGFLKNLWVRYNWESIQKTSPFQATLNTDESSVSPLLGMDEFFRHHHSNQYKSCTFSDACRCENVNEQARSN